MEKLITISTQTYINVISSAALSRRYALMQELAVGLAVHAETGVPTRESKQTLYKIYAAAGYDCEDQYGVDYKSTNRRINAGAFLFNKLGASRIEEWIAGHVEMQLIAAIAAELEKLEIKSVNDVLAYVGRPVIAKRPEAFVTEIVGEDGKVQTMTIRSAPTIHEEPLAEAHTKLEEYAGPFHPELAPRPFWIPEWVDEAATQHVNLDNVHIDIKQDASKDELIAAAMKLLAMANEMENIPVPEVPPEPPKTSVVRSRRSKKVKDAQ